MMKVQNKVTMNTGQCLYCHALVKNLCLPCQFKVHMMHSGPVDTVCNSTSERPTPCSPKSNPETGNLNCKSCDYYVEIISKLTADVCEDDLVKTIMSCITDSQACESQRAVQNKKSGSEILTSAFASFLQSQAVCSANATRRLLSSLKPDTNLETPEEANTQDLASPLREASSPQALSILLPSEISSKKAPTPIPSKSGIDDRRTKRPSSNLKATSESKKLKQVSNSPCEKESFPDLGKSKNKSQDIKTEDGLFYMGEVYSSSLKNQKPLASSRSIKKRSLADENVELDENTNNRSSNYKNKSQDGEYMRELYSSSFKEKEQSQTQYVGSKSSLKKRSLADENVELGESSINRFPNHKNKSQDGECMGELYSSSLKGKGQDQMQYASSKSIKKRSLAEENVEFEDSINNRSSNYKNKTQDGEYMGELYSSSMKGGEQNQQPYVNSKSIKNRSIADENVEFEESINNRSSKGVIKNVCGGNMESHRKGSIHDNRRAEMDEKIGRCLDQFDKERLKSSTSQRYSKSPSPCSRHSSPETRSTRSGHHEFYYPVTVAFRSRSCCNVDGESYDELISFNSASNARKIRTHEERCSKSGERKLIYRTNSDGQFKSVVIAMAGEDSETDSDGSIPVNYQRKPISRCCSPSMIDKAEQASGLVDASTQYEKENTVDSYRTSQGGVAGLWIISEKVESTSRPGVKQKSDQLPSRKSSPPVKPTLKQSTDGGQKSSARPQSAGKPGGVSKAGKRTSPGKPTVASKSKVGSNKMPNLRQPEWQK